MQRLFRYPVIFALLLFPGACATVDEVLFQSLAGEEPGRPLEEIEWIGVESLFGTPRRIAPDETARAGPNAPPVLAATSFQRLPVTMTPGGGGETSRTVRDLGQHYQELQRDFEDRNAELQQRRAALAAKGEDYAQARRALEHRIDAAAWRQAQIRLDLLYLEIDRTNALATQVEIDRGSFTHMATSARAAAALEGVTGEEQDNLALIDREATARAVLLEAMTAEISDDIGSQNQYADGQRDHLEQVAQRINFGGGSMVAGRRSTTPTGETLRTSLPVDVASAVDAGHPVDNRQPLVVIRFNRPDVRYATELYDAISYAVSRRPDVMFDIVAMTPESVAGQLTPETRRHFEGVFATLAEMGVPQSRVTVQAFANPAVTVDEVRIYLR